MDENMAITVVVQDREAAITLSGKMTTLVA
jgi:hypothetical protein